MSSTPLPASPRSLAAHATSGTAVAFQSRVQARGWPADLALLGLVLLLALGPRLINLDAYSGLFDEGIRAEQLLLMDRGYRPFKDIFAAQGPLLLDAFYPLYALFNALMDPPLAAVRLVAVTYSLVGLAGLYWLGRQLAGRAGGFAAALLLALSPLYLEGSRLALAEVPALAPAILSLGCALRYGRSGRLGWLVGAGLLLTLSLLMKPITLAAVPAVALAALLRGRRGLYGLLVVGAAMAVLTGVLLWLLGFNEVREQILSYRAAASREFDWSLRKNLDALGRGLAFEPLALLPLALIGGLALLASDWRRALPVVLWAVLGLMLLLRYSPLHGKHIVVLVPGAALLAGAGLARAGQGLSGLLPPGRRWLATVPLALAAAWYLLGLVPLLPQTGQLLKVTRDTDVDPAFEQYSDAVTAIQALTGPGEMIVTDQPYLAFLAGRAVPPNLVDASLTRIRSRSLTGAKARAAAEAFDVKVVLLWGDRLRSLPAFQSWVESNYQLVKVYNRRGDSDRALYLRRSEDLAAARTRLTLGLGGPTAEFAGELRLAGAALDRSGLAPGQAAVVTMLWEQLRPTATDYHVLLELRAADGRSLDDQQESLGGGGGGTSQWTPGRWLVQSSFVKADEVEPGEYTVSLALYDSRARAAVPIDGSGNHQLAIGTLTVR